LREDVGIHHHPGFHHFPSTNPMPWRLTFGGVGGHPDGATLGPSGTYKGKFSPVCSFLGYQARGSLPATYWQHQLPVGKSPRAMDFICLPPFFSPPPKIRKFLHLRQNKQQTAYTDSAQPTTAARGWARATSTATWATASAPRPPTSPAAVCPAGGRGAG